MNKIEELADQLLKGGPQMKKAIVEGVPRQAVLKPAHAVYRLQNQRFDIGDRVVMVKDSGSVPLSMKGVVVGINVKTLDVVWDVLFMSGSTLGDRFVAHQIVQGDCRPTLFPRCSQCRGATVDFDSCLNLSNCQLITSTNSSEIQQLHPNSGPHGVAGQWPPPKSVWKSPASQR